MDPAWIPRRPDAKWQLVALVNQPGSMLNLSSAD
jgi:hypothetical protein